MRFASTLGIVVGILVAPSAASAQADRTTNASSTWVVDGSAGVPRLRSADDFNLVGDLTLGWAASRWGIVASGSAHTFALDSDTTLSDLDAYSGQGEGFIRFGADSAAFELRARVGASLYDTTFIQAPAGSVAFQDETSVTYEGGLLVGARLRPSERWHLHLLVGVGAYDEEYNATQANAAAGAASTAGIVDTSRFAGRGEGSLQVRWLTFPGTLSLRVRSEAQLYSLTRSSDVVAIIGGKVGTTSTTDTLRQIETSNRFFVQTDILTFADVSPALFTGFDTLSVSASGGSKTDVVPVVGVGLFKPEP